MARAGKAEVDGPRTALQRECALPSFGDDHVQSLQAFLDSGADPNELDGFQRSPLSLLCSQSGHAGAARILLHSGAHASPQDMWGRTPLHWCADCGWLDTARLLIDAGALVNATTKNGDTPLLWASKAGRSSLVEHLLKAGADPLLRNNRDEQAVDVAADDLTRILVTSMIQGSQGSIGDVHSLLKNSEEEVLGVEKGQVEEESIHGSEDLKRPAADSALLPSTTSPAFSKYSKQNLSAGSGPKKLKISLKKK